jgi:hypothetical protein
VHQAALLGFPPHWVGLMLLACRAHLYSWRVGHCMVCAVERPRRLVYLLLTRVRVLRHRFTFLSWHKYRCSKPPIPRTHLVRHCPLWLVVTIVASVLMVGFPTMMLASPVFRLVPDSRRCSSGFGCFVVMLNPSCHLVQGSLRSGNRADSDYRTVGTTLGAGEGAI